MEDHSKSIQVYSLCQKLDHNRDTLINVDCRWLYNEPDGDRFLVEQIQKTHNRSEVRGQDQNIDEDDTEEREDEVENRNDEISEHEEQELRQIPMSVTMRARRNRRSSQTFRRI